MDQKQKDHIFDSVKNYILAGGMITLNGEPATIAGRVLDFPVIRSLESHTSAEFSWSAVARILAAGGEFEI